MTSVGCVVAWPSEGEPLLGWIVCNGSPLSSAEYPELYRTIGITHGGGYNRDGTKATGSDFNVPDYRGVFLRGSDTKDHSGTFAGYDPEAQARTPVRKDGNAGA